MQKMLIVLSSIVCLGLIGCAKPVQKNWGALSGSRSDGTIKMAYQYNPVSEIPQVNNMQALTLASKRCQAWGYAEAEAFGTNFSECNNWSTAFGSLTCVKETVTREFQCIGTYKEPLLSK